MKFSSALRAQTKEPETVVEADGSIAAVFGALSDKYGPEFAKRLFDEKGSVKKFIAVYINGEDIRFKQGLETPVANGDEILILPAVSGG